MATLKSKKMVRSRDLNSPLAASTMDKAKGNGKGLGAKLAKGVKGDPPKKSSAKSKKPTKKKYTGRPEHHTQVTYGGRTQHYKKGEAEKTLKDFSSALKSGKIKKFTRNDGSIEYREVKKKKN